jgi:hypothetical protein
MNFFKRRKILKGANFLDLRPVRVLAHEVRDDGCVNLLLPRFRNKFSSSVLQPRSKQEHITIRLDRFGSHAWMEITGETTVAGICESLHMQFTDQLHTREDTEDRVTQFLTRLYQERYITFREIQDDKPSGRK